ncbi:hypothetical protein HBI76_216540 [Parastagonospora nodorum]|nr:hypothetical protein HBI76_216540 [Parastagonospora nodorum]
MAQFKDLPAEILHEIAKCIAPTCCEDLKHDILSFRAVERRTWLIANQHAFKYMTLCVRNPKEESKLGLFARLSKPDLNGCNIIDMVREVCVVAPSKLIPVPHITIDLMESDYRRIAWEIFCRLLLKKAAQLTSDEQAAGRLYWELCMEPFLPLNDSIVLGLRLQRDMAGLPQLRTVYANTDEDVLDHKSDDWKTLVSLGVGDTIWDTDERCFHRLDLKIGATGSIHYSTRDNLGQLIVEALPPSVSTLKWQCHRLEWFEVKAYHQPVLCQIIEFSAELSPKERGYTMEAERSMIYDLQRVQVLQLSSVFTSLDLHAGCLNVYGINQTTEFLPTLLDFNLPSSLKIVKLKDYVLTASGLKTILTHMALLRVALHLENLVMVHEIRNLCTSTGAAEVARVAADFWKCLLQDLCLDYAEYISSGLFNLIGSFVSIDVSDGDCTVKFNSGLAPQEVHHGLATDADWRTNNVAIEVWI